MKEIVRDMLDTIAAYEQKGRPETSYDGKTVRVVESPDGNEAYTVRIPRLNFYLPPCDVEKDYGITGIAGDYKLPEGLSLHDLQIYAMLMKHACHTGDIQPEDQVCRLGMVFSALAALNPGLNDLKFDHSDGAMMYDVILGVASAFNTRDIQSYIDDPHLERMNDPAYMASFERLMKNTDGIVWFAAKETIDSISDQLEAKADYQRRPVFNPDFSKFKK